MRSRLGFALFIVLLFADAAAAQIGKATWATTVPKTFAEPSWWDQGIVFVGNWEPLLFRRRNGTELPVNLEEVYRKEHTEATVLKLKEAGVNLIITHFYKAGLQAEREDTEMAKQLSELCHKHGLKIGTYIGGTMFAETLFREVPEAKQWIRLDEHGNPIRYGQQTYRYRPDFNHPGYVEYMKRVIRIAVEDLKTDLIHFDNHALIAPPWTGNTPEINRRFREFLSRKYTPEQRKHRFGFSDISAVTVPEWQGVAQPASMSPIGDPVIEEWIDFRCQDFADYYAKLAAYIRQLNPQVIVELNPHGIFGTNRAFLHGIDHARLVPHGSVFWSEEPNEAKIDPEGNLVSKIRSMKLARSLGQTLFSYTGTQRADPRLRSYRLLMAESMAFNRNSLGDVGGPLIAYDLPDEARRYIRFYRDHNQHFAQSRDVADVAVLRSFPSMAFNSGGPHLETTLAEQFLIQHKIPFTYVFDGNLADLAPYKAVILANQESLSDRALDQLRTYVKNGGGLLATGKTSLYNDWRRRRADFGLSDVLDIHNLGKGLPPAHRNEFGNGRAAYLPFIESVDLPVTTTVVGFGNRYWKLPKNDAAILEELSWITRGRYSVELKGAPPSTVMNLTERTDGAERVLHLLNYRIGAPVDGLAATVSAPQGRTVKAIELFSPDQTSSEKLQFHQDGGRIQFKLPRLEVYQMIVMKFTE